MRWAVGLVHRCAGRSMRAVWCCWLSLHREEIACVRPDEYISCMTKNLTHRSMELSRVSWREQRRWWSKTVCGAKALHVLEYLHHPLLIRQARAARTASGFALILASISLCSLLSSSSRTYNISPQCYNNIKIRYITQWMKRHRSTNLEFLHAMLWAVLPRSYGWARARAPCSDLRQSGSGGQVDCPVDNPILPMPLASSDPHEGISVDVLGPWIVI
jgi:hypothetical protein